MLFRSFRAITAGTVFLAGMFFLLNDMDYMRLFLLTLSSFGLFQGIEGMGIFSIFAKMTAQSLERMDMIDLATTQSDGEVKIITEKKEMFFLRKQYLYKMWNIIS